MLQKVKGHRGLLQSCFGEMPALYPDVGVQGRAAAGESAQAQREQGCIAGWEQRKGGTQVQALEGGGAGKKRLRSRSTGADRAPGVGNWD